MTEREDRHYRFRDRGPGPHPKWNLELYVVYPDIPDGTLGHGPYCINWTPIKAADRAERESQLVQAGITELPND